MDAVAGRRRYRLNLIAWNNGVGLTRDLALLAEGLRAAGFDVTVTPIGRGKLRKWFRPPLMRARHALRRWMGGGALHDANLMLEHVRPEEFGGARRQFFIPNPEWCLDSDVAALPGIDAVLTKTRHAEALLAPFGRPIASIGFTSEDRFDAAVPRERTFFHLAGRSSNKGTAALVALWRKHPEWPRLTIVQNRRAAADVRSEATNIEHRVDYLEDGELRRLQNLHRFHLCPSETEGFGHYLVEAMSVGAITLTTDAPPMNELVSDERGMPVAYDRTGTQNLATTYHFDETAMEATIDRLLALPEPELGRMGGNARAWYLANHADFPRRLQAAIGPLLDDLPGRRR